MIVQPCFHVAKYYAHRYNTEGRQWSRSKARRWHAATVYYFTLSGWPV